MADGIPLGDRAVRFTRPDRSARSIVHAVRAWPGVVDVVVARTEVAAYFADAGAALATRPRWPQWIDALATAPDDPEPVRDIELRVIYNGPDLEHVAAATGRHVDDVRALHAAATYTVEFMGFSPGFGYLGGLPPALELARRATPRTRVPAGSLAIAGLQSAVYPFDSPGGWHLIGSVVGVRMFGPDGPLLRLGDRVRFVP
ncbi:MAG TPA: carboxyltransferase domain-containing protein [Kofleriaceae bacterium]|nr:carboxyltransferase domain-containing protein [Kofleriaceae bacterium]